MHVYRGNSEVIDVVIDNKTQLKKSILNEDFIQASFIMDSYFDFQIGDYVNWRGKRYTIFKQPSGKKSQANQFQYNIDFESDQYRFQNAVFLFDGQPEFFLIGDFEKFANLIILNMNRIAGDGYYQLGEVPDTDVKNLNFSNFNCLYVAQFICQEFSKEFYFSEDGRTLNFVDKVGKETGLFFQFRSGLRNIERQKVTDENLVTRLYAFGGSRNITNDYGGIEYTGKRLRLPDDPYYLEKNEEQFGIIEGIVNFDEVYPRRTGIVSAVFSDDIFKFTDTSMDFDLNDQLIDGVVAKLTFNTGRLAGYEFEIAQYTHSSKQFSIIQYQDTNGFAFPSEGFKIEVGDEYILHDIEMPQSYINNAETELQEKAEEYLQQNSLPNVIYDIVPDYPYLRKNLLQLEVGDIVNIRDDEFGIEIQTRIISLTQSLANEYLYSIKVGDKVTVTYLNSIIATTLENESNIRLERYDRTVQYNQIRRSLKNIDELRDTIFDPDGYFDVENIRPLSIETSMLTVGTKGQQFIIRNLLIEANYQSNPDMVRCGDGVLVHFTIDDKGIKEWNIAGDIFDLTEPGEPYYIYAKCVKNGSTGVFEVTTTQYNTNEADYYYFLIGVVHSVIDNVRGVSLTYGQTTINGKFITTGRVQSIDGYNFFDLDTGQFKIGNETSSLDWNVSTPNKLTLKGSLIQTPSGDLIVLPNLLGEYNNGTDYFEGDVVTFNGNSYMNITKDATTGVIPTNTSHWELFLEKGVDGQDGADGADGEDGEDGPSIVYTGNFSSSRIYYNNSLRRDVVKYNGVYYIYRGTNGIALAWSSANWENFGAQFESVATNLLLAENANIADWIIKDGKITSQNTYNSKPRAQLNGEDGIITLVSPRTIYTSSGGNYTVEQTIKIDSMTGEIVATHSGNSTQESGTSEFGSDGVRVTFPNKAKTDGAYNVRAGIMADVRGKLSASAFANLAAIAGVYGTAENTHPGGAPSFGGYFHGLFADRAVFKITSLPGATWTIVDEVFYIDRGMYGSSNITLPSNPEVGRFVFVCRSDNGGVIVNGNGVSIRWKGSNSTTRGIGSVGEIMMFIYDSAYWHAMSLWK